MSHKIHVLSPLLANQIAAGEVVERPASVVKELVENSLDAGAKRIQIDIEGGGIKLIQVRDDGIGISQYDLELAMSRHATSKISNIDDLHQITSLGFRGEALASICSVSRFSITSCPCGSNQANKAMVEGRHLKLTLSPASHPIGTTVCARDLFFNTPARRKFLRAERTEYQHIEDLIRRFALSRFDVGFVLRNEQRLIFNLRPAANDVERRQRLVNLMGNNFIKQATLIDREAGAMKIYGWLGSPECARSSVDRQFFYVNGRIVRDKVIQHALRQAFAALIPEGRHPVYALYFELPFDKVDVNVHPTKHELRFHEARQVHDFILSTVQRGLEQEDEQQPEIQYQHALQQPLTEVHEAVGQKTYATKSSAISTAMAPNRHVRESSFTNKTRNFSSKYGELLGMLSVQLILAKTEHHFNMIHVSLAKQHIAYEKLSSVMTGVSLKAQPLLIPQTIDIQDTDYSVILSTIKQLAQLSVELDTLGPNTIVIRKLPAVLKGCRFKNIIPKLLKPQPLKEIILLLSQNIYYSGGMLNKDDMNQLLEELSCCELNASTSHMPSPVKCFAIEDLEKDFILHEALTI